MKKTSIEQEDVSLQSLDSTSSLSEREIKLANARKKFQVFRNKKLDESIKQCVQVINNEAPNSEAHIQIVSNKSVESSIEETNNHVPPDSLLVENSSELKQEISRLMQTIQSMNQDRKMLDIQVNEMFLNVEKLMNDNSKLIMSNKSLTEMNQDLQRRLQAHTNQNEQELSKSNAETLLLSRSIKDLKDKVVRMEKELELRSDRIESLLMQCNEHKQAFANQDIQHEATLSELAKTTEANNVLLLENTKIMEKFTYLEQKAQSLEFELSTQKEKHAKARDQHLVEVVRLNQVISSTEKRIETSSAHSEEQLKLANDRISILLAENEALIAQLDELRARHIKINDEKLLIIEQCENGVREISRLSSDLKSAHERLSHLERLSDIEIHYQELYQHLLYLQEQCIQLYDKDVLSQSIISSLKQHNILDTQSVESTEPVLPPIKLNGDLNVAPVEAMSSPTHPPMSSIDFFHPSRIRIKTKSSDDYDNLLEIQKVNMMAMNRLQSESYNYQKTIEDMKNTINVLIAQKTTLNEDLEKERKINILLSGTSPKYYEYLIDLAEVEALPEYISRYHDQRKQLTEQMNQKLKSVKDEFEIEKRLLMAQCKLLRGGGGIGSVSESEVTSSAAPTQLSSL